MAFVRRKGNSFYLVNKPVFSLRTLCPDLAELFPLLFRISDLPVIAEEIFLQLCLLDSTIQVKLNPFDQGRARFSDNLSWDSRLARRRP